MAFLDQSVDKYLQEKMNSFSVSNFPSSQLFDSIHFANDRIVENEMITAVTKCYLATLTEGEDSVDLLIKAACFVT
jgi:hypothetical protein